MAWFWDTVALIISLLKYFSTQNVSFGGERVLLLKPAFSEICHVVWTIPYKLIYLNHATLQPSLLTSLICLIFCSDLVICQFVFLDIAIGLHIVFKFYLVHRCLFECDIIKLISFVINISTLLLGAFPPQLCSDSYRLFLVNVFLNTKVITVLTYW